MAIQTTSQQFAALLGTAAPHAYASLNVCQLIAASLNCEPYLSSLSAHHPPNHTLLQQQQQQHVDRQSGSQG